MPPPGEGTLEKMWRKFLRSPNLQNAQIFDVLLNNQFPQATNFIPTGKQRAVRSPQADASAREFNNLRMSITQRASRDLSASRRAFQTGRPTAAAKLYERGMWGVSESGHLSELARSAGFSKAGAFRFLKTQASITGSELGGGGGVSGKQLKVLEQILSVLKKGGGREGGSGGGGDSRKRTPKGLWSKLTSRSGGFWGGTRKLLTAGEDTGALGFIDPWLAGAAVVSAGIKFGAKVYRGAYGMAGSAIQTRVEASRVSRLLGLSSREVLSPLGLSKGSKPFSNAWQKWGITQQTALAMENAYGVSGAKTPMGLLVTLARSKYLGGLPSTDVAGFVGKLVGIGGINKLAAARAINAVATISGRAGINAGISMPGYMSVFQSVVGGNAPVISSGSRFYDSFIARGGAAARSGSLQRQTLSGLERMASHPNMTQLALGEGLLFGGVNSLPGLEANVRKFGGKGALKTLHETFLKNPHWKKDISGSLKRGFPLAAYRYVMSILQGNPRALEKLSVSEAKSLGMPSSLVSLALSNITGAPLSASVDILNPGKMGKISPLSKYRKSRQGETGTSLTTMAQKAVVELQLSDAALKAFGGILETVNSVMLKDFIPIINDTVTGLKEFIHALNHANSHSRADTPLKTYEHARFNGYGAMPGTTK